MIQNTLIYTFCHATDKYWENEGFVGDFKTMITKVVLPRILFIFSSVYQGFVGKVNS